MQALASALDTTKLYGQEEEYLLQYFGVEIKGRPVVLVNGVHRHLMRDDTLGGWRTVAVSICDVGIGAFQAWFDVEGQKVSEIRFDPGWPPER